MPTSRRTLLKLSLATAGGAVASALLAACGETPAPTATSAPTVPGPTTAPTVAPTTAPAAMNAATVAPTVAAPRPTNTTMGAIMPTAPATTGTVATTAPATMMTAGKTIPELRVGVDLLAASMDPQEGVFNHWIRVHYSHYDTLIRRDFLDNSKLVPALATEWRRTDDKTLEMTLRRDVKWHDGTPFTAADVKYTFDRIVSKNPKLAVATPTYFPLASVEQLDDYRVRFVSSAVDPIMEKRFAGLGGQIIPAEYHKRVGADAFRTKSMGTGPYTLVEFVQDDRIVFAANDAYFGGTPAARKVTLRFIPEAATRIAALQSGEVDIITGFPPDQIAPISRRSDVIVRGVPLANIHILRYTMKVKPFEKREIRQAANYAIDRKALTEQLWSGNAVWTRGFQFEGEDFYDTSRPQTPYDPDRAKQLLQQGGYAGEPITNLVTSPSSLTLEKEAAEVIAEMWRRVGINAKLDFVEFAQKWGGVFGNEKYQVASSSFNNGVADPDGYLWRGFGPDHDQQRKGWWAAESTTEYNRLGTEARTTLDRAKRSETYKKMLDIFEAEAPGTTLYLPKESYAMRANIDWTPYPLYYMDLRPYNFKVK